MKRSPKNPYLATALAIALVSGAAGYYLGSSLRSGAPGSSDGARPALAADADSEGLASSASDSAGSDEDSDRYDVYASGSESLQLATSLANLSSANAPALLAKLRALPPSGESRGLMRAFFVKWGEVDPQAALEASKSFTGRDRMRYLSLAAAGWSRADPDAAWSYMVEASNNGLVRSVELDPLIRELAKRDIADAAQRVLSLDGDDTVRDGIRSIVRAAEDTGNFAQTYAALSAVPNDDMRRRSTEALFRRWSELDADAPLAAIDRITLAEERDAAMRGFFQGWAQTDSMAAYQYLLDNYDDPIAASAARDIGRQLARNLTGSELISAIDMATDPEIRQSIASSIIGDIARADPATAMRIAEQAEDAKTRARQTQIVLNQWASSDYDAAADYFRKLDDDKVKARSITAFLQSKTLEADIENGTLTPKYFDLVSSIESAKQRENSLRTYASIARGLQRHGQTEQADKMAYAIETSPLIDDKARQKLLERIYAND